MPSARLAPDAAAFYAAQSAFSNPGSLAPLYADLPDDPTQLACVARDLMVHRLEGEQFRYAIPQDRLHNDAESRYLDDILRIIIDRNDAPLTQRRDVGDRFVGVCRDFALLHCSFLRHAGVPARLRSGFADYFGPDGFHGDHMVTEYWDTERGWLLADPELADPMVIDTFRIGFDPMDVPRDPFWSRARRGRPSERARRTRRPSDSPTGGADGRGVVRGRQHPARPRGAEQGRDTAVGHLGCGSGQRR
ncbi:transglutaminase-like domain-containing protein [Streptomyces sp. YIM S03343]